MEMETSESPEPIPDNTLFLKDVDQEVDMLNVINDIREMINNQDTPTEVVNEYLKKVEQEIAITENKSINEKNDKIIKLIKKHPYFKNPCNYPIRLLTVMKYLKKKGIDISENDIDLMVDELIQGLDGVKMIGNGKYIMNNQNISFLIYIQ